MPDRYQVPSLAKPEPPSDVRQLLEQIDEMTDSGKYGWAEDTLSGIRESVERTQRVTEGQQRAVNNIEAARQSDRAPSERTFRRRYEGYRR